MCIHYLITVMSLFAKHSIDKFPFTTTLAQLALESIQLPFYYISNSKLVGHRVIARTP
jgi:hypothetical protein